MEHNPYFKSHSSKDCTNDYFNFLIKDIREALASLMISTTLGTLTFSFQVSTLDGEWHPLDGQAGSC